MTSQNPGLVLSQHSGMVAASAGRVRECVLAVPTGEFSGAEVPLGYRVRAKKSYLSFIETTCLWQVRCVSHAPVCIISGVPKLWTETIDAHRTALRDAILDATTTLVDEHGLVGLSMSQIAERTGIGRATLYKYFPDARAVVAAWHERQITVHLQQLQHAAASPGTPVQRLEHVLLAYARIQHKARSHHHSEPAAALHHSSHVQHAARQLHEFLRDLLAEGVAAGAIRSDASPDELADFCLHATTAALTARDHKAVQRLVTLTMDSLRA
jgi:AcrR family transcriptional regulator